MVLKSMQSFMFAQPRPWRLADESRNGLRASPVRTASPEVRCLSPTHPSRIQTTPRSRQDTVDVNGSEAQRVGNDKLAERTPEFGFRGLAYQAQSLSQLHEEMSRALDGVARPTLTRCSTTIASSRDAAHNSAAPRRGNSVTHFMTCVPSTGLTTASVKAEKEWSAVRRRTLRKATMSPAIGKSPCRPQIPYLVVAGSRVA